MERLGRLIFQMMWSVKFGMCQLMRVQIQSLCEAGESPSPLALVLPHLEWGDLFWAWHFERDTTEGSWCAGEEKHGNLQICQWQAVCTLRQVLNLSEPQFPCQSNGAIIVTLLSCVQIYNLWTSLRRGLCSDLVLQQILDLFFLSLLTEGTRF